MVRTDRKTAKVMAMLKSGERTPQDFMDKRDSLIAQGIDVDLIQSRLEANGMLSGAPTTQVPGSPVYTGRVPTPVTFEPGVLGGAGIRHGGAAGEAFGPKYKIAGKEVSYGEAYNYIMSQPPQLKEQLFNQLREETITDIPTQALDSAITAAEIPLRVMAPVGGGGWRPSGSFGVTAPLEGLRGYGKAILKGKTNEEAIKTGLIKGLAAGTIDFATVTALKGVVETSKFLAKGSMKLKGGHADYITDKPETVLSPQRQVLDVGDDVIKAVDTYVDDAEQLYRAGIEKVGISGRGVVIKGISEKALKDVGVSKSLLASRLKRVRGLVLSDVGDDVIDKFVSGGDLTFDEARIMQSFLSKVVRSGQSNVLAREGIGAVKKLKSNFLTSIDDSIKASNVDGATKETLRGINTDYAKAMEFSDDLYNNISSGGKVKEGSMRILGEQLLGTSKNKTREMRNLIKLQEVVPENQFIEPLKASVVREAWDKGAPVFSLLGRGGLGATTGGGLGFAVGGPAGGLIGSGIGGALTSPALSRAVIPLGIKAGRLASPFVGPVVRTGTKIGATKLAEKGSDVLTNALMER